MTRVLRDAGTLLSGDALGAAFGFACMALAARRLGAGEFGVLVLCQSYVEGVENLITFTSWQALIHFGSQALESGDGDRYKALVKLGTVVDFVSGGAGALLSVLGAFALKGLLGWGGRTVHFAALYSVVLVVPYHATPLAVLRMYGRFSVLAGEAAVTGALRCLGIGLAYALRLDFTAFVVIWLASDVVERGALWVLAWRELGTHGQRPGRTSSVAGARERFRGFGSFLVSSNLVGSTKTVTRYIDVLAVGNLLGPAAAGIYRVGKQLALVASYVTDPVLEAVYPELTALWVRRQAQDFRALAFRLGAICGALGVLGWGIAALIGRRAIVLVFGTRYLPAFPVMLTVMAGVVIGLALLPLQPAVLAMGRHRLTLAVVALATAVYAPLLLGLVSWMGLTGAGIAYATYAAVVNVGLLVPALARLRAAKGFRGEEKAVGVVP